MARRLCGMDHFKEIAVPSPLTTDNREFKHRHCWVMDINQKWGLLPFKLPLCYHICISKSLYSCRGDLTKKYGQNHCPRMQKVHFWLLSVALYLDLTNITIQSMLLFSVLIKWYVHVQEVSSDPLFKSFLFKSEGVNNNLIIIIII